MENLSRYNQVKTGLKRANKEVISIYVKGKLDHIFINKLVGEDKIRGTEYVQKVCEGVEGILGPGSIVEISDIENALGKAMFDVHEIMKKEKVKKE